MLDFYVDAQHVGFFRPASRRYSYAGSSVPPREVVRTEESISELSVRSVDGASPPIESSRSDKSEPAVSAESPLRAESPPAWAPREEHD